LFTELYFCSSRNEEHNISVLIDRHEEKLLRNEEVYTITVCDTGCGMELASIPTLMGTLFSSLKVCNEMEASIGAFGVGVKGALLYSLSTRPTTTGLLNITSSTRESKFVSEVDVTIQDSRPVIVNTQTTLKSCAFSGTSVSLLIVGDFSRARKELQEYFDAILLVNQNIFFDVSGPEGFSITSTDDEESGTSEFNFQSEPAVAKYAMHRFNVRCAQ
jgi:DNA topoisomerase-6 subunit B